MIRTIRVSLGCIAALWVVAAQPQNAALTTKEGMLREKEAAAAALAAPGIAADKLRPRIGGFWEPEKSVDALVTIDGKAPPMTAAGKRLQRQRMAQIRANKSEDPMVMCLPPGTPRDMLSPGPFMIAQTPAKITMLHQHRHLIRHVYLDGPLALTEPDPWWEGHFSGHWNAEVLVIESAGFNGSQWLDGTGLPQSPNMKVVERFKLVGPDTLEDLITLEDPEFYSRPWTIRLTFRRLPGEGRHLVQEECSEKLLEFPLKVYAPTE
jgi:hypothetical protein